MSDKQTDSSVLETFFDNYNHVTYELGKAQARVLPEIAKFNVASCDAGLDKYPIQTAFCKGTRDGVKGK